MPLSYAIACSILLSLVYRWGHFEYFYSNHDLIISSVPWIENMILHSQAKEMDTAWYYLFPHRPIDSVKAHKNNLPCLMWPIEKAYVMALEERYTNYWQN